MPTASSRKAQSAHSWGGISGVSGISVRGIKAWGTRGGAESLRMMPERQVSTKVRSMYAEKRDRPVWQDEKIGRWILIGAIVHAIAAGVWYWQSRGKEE